MSNNKNNSAINQELLERVSSVASSDILDDFLSIVTLLKHRQEIARQLNMRYDENILEAFNYCNEKIKKTLNL